MRNPKDKIKCELCGKSKPVHWNNEVNLFICVKCRRGIKSKNIINEIIKLEKNFKLK